MTSLESSYYYSQPESNHTNSYEQSVRWIISYEQKCRGGSCYEQSVRWIISYEHRCSGIISYERELSDCYFPFFGVYLVTTAKFVKNGISQTTSQPKNRWAYNGVYACFFTILGYVSPNKVL
jgi:hypothetical protein